MADLGKKKPYLDKPRLSTWSPVGLASYGFDLVPGDMPGGDKVWWPSSLFPGSLECRETLADFRNPS